MGASKVVRNLSAVCFQTVVCREAVFFSFLFERLICAKLFKSSEVDQGYD